MALTFASFASAVGLENASPPQSLIDDLGMVIEQLTGIKGNYHSLGDQQQSVDVLGCYPQGLGGEAFHNYKGQLAQGFTSCGDELGSVASVLVSAVNEFGEQRISALVATFFGWVQFLEAFIAAMAALIASAGVSALVDMGVAEEIMEFTEGVLKLLTGDCLRAISILGKFLPGAAERAAADAARLAAEDAAKRALVSAVLDAESEEARQAAIKKLVTSGLGDVVKKTGKEAVVAGLKKGGKAVVEAGVQAIMFQAGEMGLTAALGGNVNFTQSAEDAGRMFAASVIGMPVGATAGKVMEVFGAGEKTWVNRLVSTAAASSIGGPIMGMSASQNFGMTIMGLAHAGKDYVTSPDGLAAHRKSSNVTAGSDVTSAADEARLAAPSDGGVKLADPPAPGDLPKAEAPGDGQEAAVLAGGGGPGTEMNANGLKTDGSLVNGIGASEHVGSTNGSGNGSVKTGQRAGAANDRPPVGEGGKSSGGGGKPSAGLAGGNGRRPDGEGTNVPAKPGVDAGVSDEAPKLQESPRNISANGVGEASPEQHSAPDHNGSGSNGGPDGNGGPANNDGAEQQHLGAADAGDATPDVPNGHNGQAEVGTAHGSDAALQGDSGRVENGQPQQTEAERQAAEQRAAEEKQTREQLEQNEVTGGQKREERAEKEHSVENSVGDLKDGYANIDALDGQLGEEELAEGQRNTQARTEMEGAGRSDDASEELVVRAEEEQAAAHAAVDEAREPLPAAEAYLQQVRDELAAGWPGSDDAGADGKGETAGEGMDRTGEGEAAEEGVGKEASADADGAGSDESAEGEESNKPGAEGSGEQESNKELTNEERKKISGEQKKRRSWEEEQQKTVAEARAMVGELRAEELKAELRARRADRAVEDANRLAEERKKIRAAEDKSKKSDEAARDARKDADDAKAKLDEAKATRKEQSLRSEARKRAAEEVSRAQERKKTLDKKAKDTEKVAGDDAKALNKAYEAYDTLVAERLADHRRSERGDIADLRDGLTRQKGDLDTEFKKQMRTMVRLVADSVDATQRAGEDWMDALDRTLVAADEAYAKQGDLKSLELKEAGRALKELYEMMRDDERKKGDPVTFKPSGIEAKDMLAVARAVIELSGWDEELGGKKEWKVPDVSDVMRELVERRVNISRDAVADVLDLMDAGGPSGKGVDVVLYLALEGLGEQRKGHAMWESQHAAVLALIDTGFELRAGGGKTVAIVMAADFLALTTKEQAAVIMVPNDTLQKQMIGVARLINGGDIAVEGDMVHHDGPVVYVTTLQDMGFAIVHDVHRALELLDDPPQGNQGISEQERSRLIRQLLEAPDAAAFRPLLEAATERYGSLEEYRTQPDGKMSVYDLMKHTTLVDEADENLDSQHRYQSGPGKGDPVLDPQRDAEVREMRRMFELAGLTKADFGLDGGGSRFGLKESAANRVAMMLGQEWEGLTPQQREDLECHAHVEWVLADQYLWDKRTQHPMIKTASGELQVNTQEYATSMAEGEGGNGLTHWDKYLAYIQAKHGADELMAPKSSEMYVLGDQILRGLDKREISGTVRVAAKDLRDSIGTGAIPEIEPEHASKLLRMPAPEGHKVYENGKEVQGVALYENQEEKVAAAVEITKATVGKDPKWAGTDVVGEREHAKAWEEATRQEGKHLGVRDLDAYVAEQRELQGRPEPGAERHSEPYAQARAQREAELGAEWRDAMEKKYGKVIQDKDKLEAFIEKRRNEELDLAGKNGQTGQPVMIQNPNDADCRRQSATFTEAGLVHRVLDSQWIQDTIHEAIDLGVPPEKINEFIALRKDELLEWAGQEGSILIINQMGGRGLDTPVTDEANEKGGLVVVSMGFDIHSARNDIQVDYRTARGKNPGETIRLVAKTDETVAALRRSANTTLVTIVRVKETESAHEKAKTDAVKAASEVEQSEAAVEQAQYVADNAATPSEQDQADEALAAAKDKNQQAIVAQQEANERVAETEQERDKALAGAIADIPTVQKEQEAARAKMRLAAQKGTGSPVGPRAPPTIQPLTESAGTTASDGVAHAGDTVTATGREDAGWKHLANTKVAAALHAALGETYETTGPAVASPDALTQTAEIVEAAYQADRMSAGSPVSIGAVVRMDNGEVVQLTGGAACEGEKLVLTVTPTPVAESSPEAAAAVPLDQFMKTVSAAWAGHGGDGVVLRHATDDTQPDMGFGSLAGADARAIYEAVSGLLRVVNDRLAPKKDDDKGTADNDKAEKVLDPDELALNALRAIAALLGTHLTGEFLDSDTWTVSGKKASSLLRSITETIFGASKDYADGKTKKAKAACALEALHGMSAAMWGALKPLPKEICSWDIDGGADVKDALGRLGSAADLVQTALRTPTSMLVVQTALAAARRVVGDEAIVSQLDTALGGFEPGSRKGPTGYTEALTAANDYITARQSEYGVAAAAFTDDKLAPASEKTAEPTPDWAVAAAQTSGWKDLAENKIAARLRMHAETEHDPARAEIEPVDQDNLPATTAAELVERAHGSGGRAKTRLVADLGDGQVAVLHGGATVDDDGVLVLDQVPMLLDENDPERASAASIVELIAQISGLHGAKGGKGVRFNHGGTRFGADGDQVLENKIAEWDLPTNASTESVVAEADQLDGTVTSIRGQLSYLEIPQLAQYLAQNLPDDLAQFLSQASGVLGGDTTAVAHISAAQELLDSGVELTTDNTEPFTKVLDAMAARAEEKRGSLAAVVARLAEYGLGTVTGDDGQDLYRDTFVVDPQLTDEQRSLQQQRLSALRELACDAEATLAAMRHAAEVWQGNGGREVGFSTKRPVTVTVKIRRADLRTYKVDAHRLPLSGANLATMADEDGNVVCVGLPRDAVGTLDDGSSGQQAGPDEVLVHVRVGKDTRMTALDYKGHVRLDGLMGAPARMLTNPVTGAHELFVIGTPVGAAGEGDAGLLEWSGWDAPAAAFTTGLQQAMAGASEDGETEGARAPAPAVRFTPLAGLVNGIRQRNEGEATGFRAVVETADGTFIDLTGTGTRSGRDAELTLTGTPATEEAVEAARAAGCLFTAGQFLAGLAEECAAHGFTGFRVGYGQPGAAIHLLGVPLVGGAGAVPAALFSHHEVGLLADAGQVADAVHRIGEALADVPAELAPRPEIATAIRNARAALVVLTNTDTEPVADGPADPEALRRFGVSDRLETLTVANRFVREANQAFATNHTGAAVVSGLRALVDLGIVPEDSPLGRALVDIAALLRSLSDPAGVAGGGARPQRGTDPGSMAVASRRCHGRAAAPATGRPGDTGGPRPGGEHRNERRR